jgi:AcrR family transcriptional regulator
MARKAEIPDRILDAVLELAPITGWRALSFSEIAAEAGVSLDEAHVAFPTKPALLTGLLTRADHRVLAQGAADKDESARDRLFDVIMRRFDALRPHKQAIAAITRDLPADPVACFVTLPRFANSMAWMLEAAGLSSAGVRGAIRIKGLALIYLRTLRVWLGDDSDDQARTMATLDRNLKNAERRIRGCFSLFRCCCRPRRRGRHRGGDASPPAGEVPVVG